MWKSAYVGVYQLLNCSAMSLYQFGFEALIRESKVFMAQAASVCVQSRQPTGSWEYTEYLSQTDVKGDRTEWGWTEW